MNVKQYVMLIGVLLMVVVSLSIRPRAASLLRPTGTSPAGEAALVAAAQAADRGEAERELGAVFDRLNTAYQKKNLDAFTKIVHDKYFYSYNLKIGEFTVGKDAHLQSVRRLRAAPAQPSLIQFNRESAVFYNAKVAMTLYDVYSKPTGPSDAHVEKVAKWFVKSGDSWQLVYEWRAPKPLPK